MRPRTYGDPDFFIVHWFDAGEFGLASTSQSPLKPNDVPGNAKLLDGPAVADQESEQGADAHGPNLG